MPKSRKSYRKAKIDDVEEALEDERMIGKIKKQSALGKAGDAKGESKDDAAGLFTVDTKGSFEGISKTKRRELARAKLFPPKGPNIGLSASEAFNIERAGRGLDEEAKKIAKEKAEAEPEIFDLWATEPPTAEAKRQSDAVKSGESMVRLVMQTSRPLPSSVPNTMRQKVSSAPAVLPAHEGQSVNPAPAAYENLVCAAAATELQEERDAEVVHRGMAPVTAVLQEHFGVEKVKEMDEEAKITAYRSIVMADTAEGGELSKKAAAMRSSNRKAQSKRNREHKRKVTEHIEKQAKKSKALVNSVSQVGNILKEMKERDQFLETRREFRKQMKLKRKADEDIEGTIPKHRRIGKTKFKEEALSVPDIDAAAKGLRSMPIGGRTAVKDRVESIMRRGLLPAPPEVKAGDVQMYRRRNKWMQKTRKACEPMLRHNGDLRG